MLIFGLKGACNKCKPLCDSKIYTVSVQLSMTTHNATFNSVRAALLTLHVALLKCFRFVLVCHCKWKKEIIKHKWCDLSFSNGLWCGDVTVNYSLCIVVCLKLNDSLRKKSNHNFSWVQNQTATHFARTRFHTTSTDLFLPVIFNATTFAMRVKSYTMTEMWQLKLAEPHFSVGPFFQCGLQYVWKGWIHTRDRDKRPSRPGWRGRTQWGRRCVRMSLSWRCGCATCRAARLRSGSLQSSRRSWCSPSRPDTRSRTPRPAPACAWRCSSEWPWLSGDGCPPWVSAFNRTKGELAARHRPSWPHWINREPNQSAKCVCTLSLPMDPASCKIHLGPPAVSFQSLKSNISCSLY